MTVPVTTDIVVVPGGKAFVVSRRRRGARAGEGAVKPKPNRQIARAG